MQRTGPLVELRCSARLARKLFPYVNEEDRYMASEADDSVFLQSVMRVHCPPDPAFLVVIDPDAFRMK